MPSSTTARHRTAPVNPNATSHGLLTGTGTGTGLGLVQPAGPAAVVVTAGRTASTGPARQRAHRVRAQDAARDTRQVKALTAQASAMPTLDSAVNSHRQGPAAPDPPARPLTAATASQRHRAVDVRSIEATEPDAIDIDAGPGHRHVLLRMTPDGQALTTPHDRPEGSGSR